MPYVLSLSYCLVPLCFGYLGVKKLVKLDFLEFESAPSPILVVSAFVGLWLKKKYVEYSYLLFSVGSNHSQSYTLDYD